MLKLAKYFNNKKLYCHHNHKFTCWLMFLFFSKYPDEMRIIDTYSDGGTRNYKKISVVSDFKI